MRKIACLISIVFLLLATGVTRVWAEEQLPPKLQKQTEEAYKERAQLIAEHGGYGYLSWPRSPVCSTRWSTVGSSPMPLPHT